MSDPAVARTTVYVGGADTNVYALAADTGEVRWRFEDSKDPFGIPAVDGETVFIPTGGEKVLYAIDATSGEQRWQFEGQLGIPKIGGDTVYAGSRDTNVYAVDVASGEERWRFEDATAPTTEPGPVGDSLYFGTVEGTLYALS